MNQFFTPTVTIPWSLLGSVPDERIVEKVWGREYILENRAEYCFKVLEIKPGYQCSLHFHRLKTESFFVYSGFVRLELKTPDSVRILAPGQSQFIAPGRAHRFSSEAGAVIFEVSTTHSDSDVERIEESRKIEQ